MIHGKAPQAGVNITKTKKMILPNFLASRFVLRKIILLAEYFKSEIRFYYDEKKMENGLTFEHAPDLFVLVLTRRSQSLISVKICSTFTMRINKANVIVSM